MSPDDLLAFMRAAPRPCKVSFSDATLGMVSMELPLIDARERPTPEQLGAVSKAIAEAQRRSDVDSLSLVPPLEQAV